MPQITRKPLKRLLMFEANDPKLKLGVNKKIATTNLAFVQKEKGEKR